MLSISIIRIIFTTILLKNFHTFINIPIFFFNRVTKMIMVCLNNDAFFITKSGIFSVNSATKYYNSSTTIELNFFLNAPMANEILEEKRERKTRPMVLRHLYSDS
jgi:hypothetical protein